MQPDQIIYLLEITAYDPGIAGTKVLRYASGTGYTTKPTDNPPNTLYEPRVLQAGRITRSCFSPGATSGQSQVGYGETILANHDKALDGLIEYGFDGRPFVVKIGYQGAAFNTFKTIFTGTLEQPTFPWNTVSLRVRDKLALLDRPYQPTRYLGNNVAPAGLEGDSELTDKVKPIVFGNCYNVRPICVNASKLIYQFHDPNSPIYHQAWAYPVYDNGVALPSESNYLVGEDIETVAPSAGKYKVKTSLGMFRLGSAPAGEITCDVQEWSSAGSNTLSRYPGDVFLRMVGRANLPVDTTDAEIFRDFNDYAALSTELAPLKTYPPYNSCGMFVDTDRTIASVLDEAVAGFGMWYGFDRVGQFHMQVLDAPSGQPVYTFTEKDLLSIERLATSDSDRGVPLYKINYQYGRNYTVQTSGLAGAVAADRRMFLKDQYRVYSVTDNTVKTTHLLAKEMTIKSIMWGGVGLIAQALLDRYKVRRDRLQIRVKIDPSTIDLFDLGKVVSIKISRYGFDNGKLFRIIGVELNCQNNSVELTLWG